MTSMNDLGKKAGIVGWYLLAIIVMFGIVFWGLIGNHYVTNNEGANCTMSYGVLCLSWESNESEERSFTRDDEGFYETEPW